MDEVSEDTQLDLLETQIGAECRKLFHMKLNKLDGTAKTTPEAFAQQKEKAEELLSQHPNKDSQMTDFL
ncbi:MAG: hypothetical protein ACI9CF_000158 [Candidatus Omnitrophota bacterium]|jgi:hypothetical protein